MTVIYSEGFETDGNGTRYATSAAEFTDGSGDFFLRTDGSDIGSFYQVTGGEGGFYFAGMDLDGEGASASQALTITGIDISGFTDLGLSVMVAEDDDGDNQDWDADSRFSVEYAIDGGAFQTALAFVASGTNTEPMQDTDLDGIGDGPALSEAFAAFAAALTGTGSTLDLRFSMSNLDAGDEDVAFDAIEITGTAAATGAAQLEITEIWPGNAEGGNLTADWFEITNAGDAAWVSGVDFDLYYDDDSADASVADPIEGIGQILAGESVVVVLGNAADAAEFAALWGEVLDLSGVQIGYSDGSGLGQGGDAVTLFEDRDGTLSQIGMEAYPDADAAAGGSWDVANGAFSSAGTTGGQGSPAAATAVNDAGEAAIGTPGNAPLAEAPETAFTLELFHVADQEGSAASVADAPNLSAVLAALKAQDLGEDGIEDNTLFLSSGDAIIPGVFYSASEAVFGSAGIADIQIQNELGIQAIAFGNHEFDMGTTSIAALISGEANGDFSALTGSALAGLDFTGTAMSYLSANLDFSTDPAMAALEVAGGGASTGGTVTSSVVFDVNGEQVGVVGATTPTLASISSPGTVGVHPEWAGTNPTDAELDALAALIQEEVDALLADNPAMNKVVLLAHMQQIGIEQSLATRLENVDIIVAGGSNTRLFDEDDRVRDGDSVQGEYPQFYTNAGGTQTVLVNTDGSYKYLGRLVIDFDAEGNIIPGSYDAAVSGAYATDDQGVADLDAADLVDPEIQAIADAIEAQIIATEGNVFGYSEVFLNGNRSGAEGDSDGVRTQETNLGNLTADANLWAAQQVDAEVVLSIKNGGGIRASIGETIVPAGGTEAVRSANAELVDGEGNVIKGEGGISQTDIQTALAFNNGLVIMTLTVEEIVGLLEHGVSALPGVAGAFPQLSGVEFSFDPDLPAGSRIEDAALVDAEGNVIAALVVDGEIQSPADTYKIVTLDFLSQPAFDSAGNFIGAGDGYPFPNTNTDPALGELGDPEVVARVGRTSFTEEGDRDGAATFAENGSEQDALAEYLAAHHGTAETAYDEADETAAGDDRIQNLNHRDGDIFPGQASDAPAIFSYGQDFDSETTNGASYVDTGNPAEDHALENNEGQAPVNSVVSGLDKNGQLGFTASYINTRNDVGLTDGDYVGVANYAGTVGAYTSGSQGYEIHDADGAMLLTFETVDTSNAAEVTVSLDVFVQETGWEEDDVIRIGVDTDGDGEMDLFLLDTTGKDVNDLGLEGRWTTLSATVPAAAAQAALMVYVDSDSSSESVYIDSVKIETAPLSEFRFAQSFENEAARAGLYFDQGDANADHDLENQSDDRRRLVDSEASGIATTGELAFNARFEDTRPSRDGMTDGSPTGVSFNTGFTGGMSDGVNGYQFKDTDGNFVLEFERIENIASDLVTVSLDVFVNETDWEARDRIAIGVDLDGDGVIDQYLADTTGKLVDEVMTEGQWITYSADIVAPDSVQLIVEHDANWKAESMMIDNVVIEGKTGVAGIPAAPAPEAQSGLAHSIASVTSIMGGAEIVAKVHGHDTLAIANGAGVTFYNMADIANPTATYQLDPLLMGADSAAVTSVAAAGTGATAAVAFAVPAADVTANGTVYVGNYVNGPYTAIEVGALPDMVAFSADGSYLLVANEGQSADADNAPDVLPNPDGSISLIALERDGDGLLTGGYTMESYDFSDASITAEALAAKGIRINPEAPSVAADIEPEFITVIGNSAYISLQENNAVAIIEDITTFTGFTIDNLVTAGEVDHLQLGFGIDTSDEDGGADIATADVTGLAMPDGLVAFEIGGVTWFAGASEGDTRGTDETRAKDANVDPDAYSAEDLADGNLGRLTVSTTDGDTDGDGDIDQLTAFGTRSFAIYDAEGTRVFDSGDLLGRIVLAEQGEERYPDGRSDNKGVEPEYVEFGEVDGTPYLFVGLERAQSVVVFDITDPQNPVYDSFIDLPDVDEPEGLKFVPAADSPTGQPLLMVAGEANSTLAIVELGSTTPELSIGAVQGSGAESEMTGQQVKLSGVIVGNYTAEGELDGVYLQSTAAGADGDAATSDGIFVYLGDSLADLPELAEGDLVTVTGTVDEYFGQTQIDTVTSLTVEAADQLDQVEAAVISLDGTGSYLSAEGYEAVEGMLVTIEDTLYVSEYYQLARFGQVTLTEGGRPYTYTQQNAPSVEGYAAWLEELAGRQIILDDSGNIDNAYTGDDAVIPYPEGGLSVDNYFRGGDSVTGLTGVMSWSWAGASGTDAWRLRPTEAAPVSFEAENLREETPVDVGGSLKVASFNVLNYFTTLDDGSQSVNGDPRGASSQAELDAQTAKLVDAMLGMGADVFGLVEIENEFGDQNGDGRFAVQYLADALNEAAGAEIYSWVDPGQGTVDSSDVITGAFIYDTTTVEVTAGSTVAILNDATSPLEFDNAVFDGINTNRASLAVSFTELATGESFTAVMNHFKSKGTVNSAEGNADAGDGAGANNAIRLQAAQALDAWLATDPTGSGDTRSLVMGDLNAYAQEDPITWLEENGYADLARAFAGEDAYSYVFDSQLGTLDYALANADMFDFVTGATEWHINADEIPVFDYNDDILDGGESSYEEEPGGTDLALDGPWRTSDHDPVLVGLDLTADALL
ncbi:ExeM/NucH family extracellular endonuclease [Mangrovicoccus algicola]|uniref:ExeM/NucH family extracellular endonuclease n=1 Tax=Mangrovicoccus algicola TaxID=2771008 RepID=A0A8J6YTD4_9RHOB|nr:ExeM/NucH family extracellular endonuclease [Mangrovicoccus algicola]MBE3637132.1 ExeM/NucH family extracellular endonuclease [Mangrovicoccus algicola]